LAEATERFAIRIHAYVLMDNHFHLLVETPEANLSSGVIPIDNHVGPTGSAR
jgi:putative transposase